MGLPQTRRDVRRRVIGISERYVSHRVLRELLEVESGQNELMMYEQTSLELCEQL
jgi:hypothetical protein